MRRVALLFLLCVVLTPCQALAVPPLARPLKLPPGLVQVLPLSKAGSYFGDAVRIVNCPEDIQNPFGTCGNVLFGGMGLFNSPLRGAMQIQFYPPLNNISHFEITHPGNLSGDDSVMKAPQFYELAVRENFIIDPPGQVSSGDLNLITGEVTNLNYKVIFVNSFYLALQEVNPNLKGTGFQFPGGYGSTEAHFQQRTDGLLDFTLLASTFLPLGKSIGGDTVRMPLPFCGPFLQCASIEAPGTSLHPHLRVSTVAPPSTACGNNCPDIPLNAIQEYTAFSHNTSLGDNFSLNIPQLGIGVGLARSQMQGRIQVQFGARTGDTVPIVISALPPEGLIGEPPGGAAPAPGISLGLLGHAEHLLFPKLAYTFSDVLTADDPFDIVTGVVNVKTGQVVGDLNYRTFFSQSIFQGLIRLNPGLAPASQRFRGPAFFEKGKNSQTVFRFNGEIIIPFAGIIFPSPDLQTGWLTGPDSQLDLYLRLQMMHVPENPRAAATKTGSASNVLSSLGDRFSYSYSIPCDPAGKVASFEYTNLNATKGGTFKMVSLAAVNCINSRSSTLAPGDFDTVTFTAFGTWSRDSDLHAATVQISTSVDAAYVTILIDGGVISDANTKPVKEPLP